MGRLLPTPTVTEKCRESGMDHVPSHALITPAHTHKHVCSMSAPTVSKCNYECQSRVRIVQAVRGITARRSGPIRPHERSNPSPRTPTPHTPGCQSPSHSPYRNAHRCSDCTSGTSPPSMQHGATAWPQSSRHQLHIRIHRMSGTRTDSPVRTRLRHSTGARQTILDPMRQRRCEE